MELFYNDIVIDGKTLIKKGKLKIDNNSINIICGDNGSGKTLLVKSIANNRKNKIKEMVLLDQNNNVTISACSVIESIAISDDCHTVEEIEKALHKLGFGYLVGLKNGHLSGGEQRIINILRCVFCKSEIIILDEPTNDLDYNIVEKIVELLKALREEKTILIVSHDDRLLEISNRIFLISANSVVMKQKDACNQCSNIAVKSFINIGLKKNIGFVSKLFGYNVVSVLTFLILTIIIFLQVHSYMSCVTMTSQNEKLSDKEILLCSFHSDEYEYCDGNNIFPLFAVEPLMNLNFLENIKLLNEMTEFVNAPNIEIYDILLDDSKYYSVFPIEYFSKENNCTINVLSYYVDKYYSDVSDDIEVDTSQYFTSIDSVENEENHMKIQLDINKYFNCLKELGNDESLIVSAEIIELNDGCTASKFYSLDEVKNLAKHDILVFSNEVSILTEQLNIFKNLWRGLKIITASVVLLLFVNIICLCMMMIDKRELIYLLRNYDYSQEEVLKAIKTRINSRKPLLIALAVYWIVLMTYMREMFFSQTIFVFLFSAMFYCSLLYKLNDLLIGKYVTRYYRWNSR